MEIASTELKQRLEHLRSVCQQAGMRVTHQRLEIFHEVANTGEHPNAEQVFQGVRERLPTVSLDTVYRTLWLLVDLGLVKTMSLGRRRTRFDANLDPHHHFVCIRCGYARDFYSEDFDVLIPPDSVLEFGEIQQTRVVVSGLCHMCGNEASEQYERGEQ